MNSNIIESLSSIPVPHVSRQAVSRLLKGRIASELDYSQVALNTRKRALVHTVLYQLAKPEITEEITRGNIALAVIRPRAEESKLNAPNDDTATSLLIDKIKPELEPILIFPFIFNEPTVRRFWEPQFIDVPPVRYHNFKSAWDEFLFIMTRGASTVVLAHSPTGDAVPTIRQKIGSWKDPAPGTIRADLSIRDADGKIAHNLIHSSESPEKVIKELEIIMTEVQKIQ